MSASHRKITLDLLNKVAAQNGGKCLSTNYTNCADKFLWECHLGHRWEAIASNVLSGSWCPTCSGNRPSSIEAMKLIARQRHGKCLSAVYSGSSKKLLWECNYGHRWEATPNKIKQGGWCPDCRGNKKSSIEAMELLAESKGGKCLSDNYINTLSNLQWECKHGHIWDATPSNVKRGTWCPICAGVKKYTIADMQKIAESRGGKCLSDNYVSRLKDLYWECSQGHRWWTKPREILSGTWCPECNGNPIHTIEEVRKLAANRGGYCLSDFYTSNRTPLEWKCSHGHRWKATFGSIVRGTWCPTCAKRPLLNIADMHDTAAERGGKCLSTIYKNAFTKLEWECLHGHRWKATPNKIRMGQWCPDCSAFLGERICREYFEQIFGTVFPKSYPPWLRNDKGYRMELDGYSEKLGLAFEHHGEQHYTTNNVYITDKQELEARKAADEDKRSICKEHGVTLFVIPQIFDRTPLNELKDYIVEQCSIYGVNIPIDINQFSADLKKAYCSNYADQQIKKLASIAETRGGRCLSYEYLGDKEKLKFKCDKGHIWYASPLHIKSGTWCPVCAGKGRTIQDMRAWAALKGGECLSSSYITAKTPLEWMCKLGHTWQAIPDSIRRGSWCPQCARQSKKC